MKAADVVDGLPSDARTSPNYLTVGILAFVILPSCQKIATHRL